MPPIKITAEEADVLLRASRAGDFPTMEIYVKKVAKRNDITEGAVIHSVRTKDEGSTALHLAVLNRHSVEYFIDKTKSIFRHQWSLNSEIFNQRDKDGRNVAVLACRHNDVKYVELMIGLGSSIKALDYQGWTAVHYAARYNAERVINYLVDERGLAPDAVGFFGKTPAHIAAMLDHVEAFKALFVAQGGCEMAPDNAGYSPIDVAFQQNAVNILRYLEEDLGMGTGRGIPLEAEKESLEKMKAIWESHPEWNVCQEWVQAVPDGVPKKVNARGAWEAEQFPNEYAKRRRIE